MILDGEIVAYNDQGKPDFQLLQQIGDNPHLVLIYQVFDILWLNGHSTEELPYSTKRAFKRSIN
jgi:bifunctional non-homologous end joining protein LigD